MHGLTRILLPDDRERDLVFYLAMEEYVARHVQEDAFFVWRVAPTVIIGRNQDLESEVNLDYCREHGVRIVRRRSGGGCVYSDKGNIMISYVSAKGDTSSVFDRYLAEMTDCLRSLGLDAVKSERNDILVGGRKVSGNAVHQLPDRTIVHGTLLYDTDLDALEKEIDAASTIFPDRPLHTVYIGGGTPTTLTPEQLERVITRVKNRFDLSACVEFTVEAGRPDSITKEKLEVLKRFAIRFNRL